VPVVLDGGDCRVGIESTILDLSGDTPRILRPGRITRAKIEALVGDVAEGSDHQSPRASGTLDAHYAPRTALLLMPRDALVAEARQQEALGKRVAVLAMGALPEGLRGIALPADVDGYAHGLYAALRSLDALGANLLLAQRPSESRDWLAVNDRLRRSAAGAGLANDAP